MMRFDPSARRRIVFLSKLPPLRPRRRGKTSANSRGVPNSAFAGCETSCSTHGRRSFDPTRTEEMARFGHKGT